ncbi:response regulator transcription factor [Nocardia sp. NBC_00403]|uniref:response regulator transcription factor n=1 Tax=Nocardia sp. NBC_00403 TaxID=2975990 RepID=UPI002E1CC007
MALILDAQHDIHVIGDHADGQELLAESAVLSDVVLLDLYLPVMDGIEVLRRLRGKPGKQPKVLMLTTIGRPQEVRRALAAGADGFVLKDMSGADLAAAVRAVHQGVMVMSSSLTRVLSFRAEAALTPRERDVLMLLGRGLSNRDVGASLGLAERTVKVHVSNLLAKLQVASASSK